MLEIRDGQVRVPSASEVSTVRIIRATGSNRPNVRIPYVGGELVDAEPGDTLVLLDNNVPKHSYECGCVEEVEQPEADSTEALDQLVRQSEGWGYTRRLRTMGGHPTSEHTSTKMGVRNSTSKLAQLLQQNHYSFSPIDGNAGSE